MNVLVLTPWYPARPGQSEGLFIQQQVHALIQSGCSVVVVSPRPRWLPVPGKRGLYWRENAGLPPHQVIDGVDVYFPRYRILPRGIGWSRVGESCFRSMRRLIEGLETKHRFDIVHGHEFLPVGFSAGYIKETTLLPFVLTVHGQNHAVSRFLAQPANNQLKQNIWNAIDAVTVVGTPLVEWLDSLHCDSSRISVIPNGAGNIERSAPLPDGYMERFGRSRVILSVSNLFPSKGIDLNLRALKTIRDLGYDNVHCIVIGEGPEQQSLTRLTSELGLDQHVTFLGRLPHAETLAYMKACDVFSLPSWQEAFGIVYIEAMAFSRPVIGCRGQGAEDIITDEQDGLLVEPHSADEVALALRCIFDAPDFAARLGKGASIRTAEFSWERNAQSYLRLYRQTSMEAGAAGRTGSQSQFAGASTEASVNCA
jgi:teichuronic acid biosynthesis glycosyltransferase TuaC